MSFRLKLAALALVSASTVACATTGFVSTWKAPDAQPLKPEGSKVAAVIMHKNEAARRAGEDALAAEITRRGGEGIPSYTLIPGTPDEAQAKAAFEKAGIAGVVVMRPVGTTQEISSTTTMYAGPTYRGYWGGGYYGYGWGGAWGGTEIRTDTIVSIETLVYSMKQNKLVWAGQSRTTNPSQVDALVKEIVRAAAEKMRREGLL